MVRLLLLAVSVLLASWSMPMQQQSRQIIDAVSQKPIAHALLHFKSSNSFLYSDENGYIDSIPPMSTTDSVSVSCLGYISIILSVRDFKNRETIYLSPDVQQMESVVITSGKMLHTVPYTTKKKDYRSSAGIRVEFATLVNFKDEHRLKRLYQVRLKLRKLKTPNFCRLHLYAIDADGKPGKDLLPEALLLTRKHTKGKEVVVDLSPYNIMTTQGGLFVGIKWLGKNNLEATAKGPYMSFTHKEGGAKTFTRTPSHPDWVFFDAPLPGYHHPPNMMVSLSYY